METLNILALHGYHGSADILRRQARPLAAALPGSVRLTYVDAPSLGRGDFGWWHEGFAGWERTRAWIADLAGRQRFDGVLGFSQGAALAGLLIADQEAGIADGVVPTFGFGIMIGGFTSHAPQHAALFRRPLTTPSLHVTGESDGVVPMRDSLRLAGRFADPVVLRHRGGHVIPSESAVLERVAGFIVGRQTAFDA